MADRAPLGVLDVAGLTAAECTPQMSVAGEAVRCALGTGPGWHEPGAELASDRLVICAIGGRVVYRITGYDPESDTYSAEWPD